MTTKSDLIAAVAASTGKPQTVVKEVVDALVVEITDSLLTSQKVQIAGLGTFAVKATAARKARNPRTGDTVDVEAGHKLTFKAASDLKAKF